ncbi:MAG TPA: phosphodiester glycosidase family protein [Miltoncostaeaceae bacterium]|nr:phosphodiester glycosidase family protein [Miltoncostaeaceae bacterium]
MRPTPTVMASTAPILSPSASAGSVRSFPRRLADGATTTVHMAAYRRDRVAVRVVALEAAEPLESWCGRTGVSDALVGGFFVTSVGIPLGELWVGGRRLASVPFDPPSGPARSCVAVDGRRVRLDGRRRLPASPRGDLLQAGPLLVRGGRPVVVDGDDPEGFSEGRAQFDSDICDGRHPRAALGLTPEALLALVCDGRAEGEAGLTLEELAVLMAELGARRAINLDGGGSAALVAGGRLLNTPREAGGAEIPGGRSIATALAFAPPGRPQPTATAASS